MVTREKKRRIQVDEDIARKRAFARYGINARWMRRKKFKKKWQAIMDIRKAEGKSQWTFREWMKIIGRKY